MYHNLSCGTGVELWSQGIQGTGTAFEEIRAITTYESAVFVAGSTSNTFSERDNAGRNDAFIQTLGASDGVPGWVHQFGSTFDDEVQTMAVGSSGVYVGRWTWGVLPGSTSSDTVDAFIKQYSLDGNTLLWTRQFGTPHEDYGTGIAVNPAGVYVVGNTDVSIQYRVETTPFIRVFGLDGADAWSRSFDNPTELGIAYGVAVDAGSVYVSGNTWMWDFFYSNDATVINYRLMETKRPWPAPTLPRQFR